MVLLHISTAANHWRCANISWHVSVIFTLQDSNMANNMLSNLYKGTPGSLTSTPASSPGHQLKANKSASYPGSPKKTESDNESLQLGNITMEVTSDIEEAAIRRIKEQESASLAQSTKVWRWKWFAAFQEGGFFVQT